MKVVLTGPGSAGDVFPMLGLGLRLNERGHHAVVVASSHFADLAERLGVDFVGLGTEDDYLGAIQNPEIFHPRRGFRAIAEFIMGWMPMLYDAVRSQVEPRRTVVGAHVLDFASRMLQEETGLPVATVLYAPAMLRSLHQMPVLSGTMDLSGLPRWAKRLAWRLSDRMIVDPPIAPSLNRLRAERGLPPVSRPFQSWVYSPVLTIGTFPAWFAPPQPDWPSQLRLTGFPLFDAAEPVPPELDAFLAEGDPPILVTLGTALAHGRDALAEAVEACRRLNRRGLILARFADVPADLPPTVRHIAFAPLSQVLPRCAAIVHHGGIGTTAAGLAAGVPQVVMPMSHDQPDNAARVRRLGVSDTLLPAQLSAASLSASLARLLESPLVHARCAEYANRVRQTDGLGETCALLESLDPSGAEAGPIEPRSA